MDKIKVSIIVPIYNSEKYLEKCLNSLVNQTLKNIEIILIDDFSTDTSSEIYIKYINNYSNIKIIKNDKNIGVSESRNKGINLSCGEYIGFVDSDDYIDLSMYENLYNSCIENSSDISMCGMIEVYDNSQKLIANKLNKTIDNKDEILEKFFKFDILAYSCNKLFRSSLIKENKIYYPDLKFGEDQYTTFVSLYYSKRISLLDECMYFYNKKEVFVSDIRFFDKRLDLFNVMEEIKNFMIEKNIFDRYRDLYQFRYIYVIFGNIIDLSIKKVNFKSFLELVININHKCVPNLENFFTNKNLSIKLKIKILLYNFNKFLYYFYVRFINF